MRTATGQVPTLETVFPAGGQIGTSVELEISGTNSTEVRTLVCNADNVRSERIDQNKFRLTIPSGLLPGQYDLWAVSDHGISNPRTFWIGNRVEFIETEPNDTISTSQMVSLDVTVNGRIEKPGDSDFYRFEAKQGQRVIIECLCERIDSRLRAVIELFDLAGKRLAVNRGFFGIDPLIDFRVPTDGSYVVKIHDLTESSSVEYFYRLDIDTQPRVAFTRPGVIHRGKDARVTLFGWNLSPQQVINANRETESGFEQVEVEIAATVTSSLVSRNGTPKNLTSSINSTASRLERVELPSLNRAINELPIRLNPIQTVLDGFAYHFPGSQSTVMIGLTDVPVVLDRDGNHRPESAQPISVPCEINGQLTGGVERDWYSIHAQRGDVLYLEAMGQRISSPVDLLVSVFDSSGTKELARFNDDIQNVSTILSTSHLDPSGRWVAPSDGNYLISIRNLIGGVQSDPRRVYQLSVRREEPDFQILAVPRRADPAGLNVRRGGREVIELIAFRRRGMHDAIRVFAADLPAGIECQDVWLGPDVNRAVMVVSADYKASAVLGHLNLLAESDLGVQSRVRSAAIFRTGTATPWGRLVSQMPIVVSDEVAVRIRADGHEAMDHHLYGRLQARHSPGSVLDVAVQVERQDVKNQASMKLMAIGLPDGIANQAVVIPADEQKGYISFWLPTNLSTGRYSLVIRGETTVNTTENKPETVVLYSDPVNFQVESAAFVVEVDPFAVTRAKRGAVIQIGYAALRQNGFIGKMHTELAMPGKITNIEGLRGRGETFVGQTDKGSLQVVVNDDAPLGHREFLRLFTVGVVEDVPVYQGSCLLTLEIVE